MKILVIGDPHGNIDKIKKIPKKEVDLILLTGDLGKADLARKRLFENIEREKSGLPKLEDDGEFLKALHMEIHNSTIRILRYLSRYAPVYTIQGNVGIPGKADVKEDKDKFGIKLPITREIFNSLKEVHMIKNSLRVIGGIRIGFLEYFIDVCWVREFKPSNFKKRLKKAKKETNKAKNVLKRFGKVDILIFHQPPYGVLDKVGSLAPKHWRGKHAGSEVILDYIEKKQPIYAFCGHIHEGEGYKKIGKTKVYNLGVAGYKIIDI